MLSRKRSLLCRVAFISSILLLSACSKKDEEAALPDPGSAVQEPTAKSGVIPLGIPACDEFLTRYRTCQAQLPTRIREEMKKGMDAAEATWRREAKDASKHDALAEACRELDKTVSLSMKAQGCVWPDSAAE